ncbi:MAG: ferredoxin-like protein [Chloroflexi bacterium]|nr:ferredoxin-like protein [Chloroflexota bacterium]
MHHTLRMYSRHREWFLRYYIFQAKWTRIPLIGWLVRAVGNLYGTKASAAYVLTLEEANEIIDSSGGLVVGPCTCRAIFKKCDRPLETEILIGATRNVFVAERPHCHHVITKEEAKDIMRRCHELGLVHTIIKCRENFYAVCNCCSCCCVPTRLRKKYGMGKALVRKADIVQEVKAWLLENNSNVDTGPYGEKLQARVRVPRDQRLL